MRTYIVSVTVVEMTEGDPLFGVAVAHGSAAIYTDDRLRDNVDIAAKSGEEGALFFHRITEEGDLIPLDIR